MSNAPVIHLRPRQQESAAPVLLTIKEAAARIRVGRRTMERWIARGTVPHVRLDGDRMVRIPVALLDEWWRQRLEGGTQ